MPADLAAILLAVQTIAPLAKTTLDAATKLRTGPLPGGRQRKQKLVEELQKLEKCLGDAGELAKIAESYLRTHQSVSELLFFCQRAERYLRDNRQSFEEHGQADLKGEWSAVDAMLEPVLKEGGSSHAVLRDRAQWVDKVGRGRLESYFDTFATGANQAAVQLNSRDAAHLLISLQQLMTPALQKAEAEIRETVYEKILKDLQSLKP